MNLQQTYAAERAPLFVRARDTGRMVECRERASQALRNARIKLAWEAAGGVEVDEWEAERFEQPDCGHVRLFLAVDSDPSSAFDGDFSERDLAELRERANRDGVCGVCAQFWDGSEWVHVDSVWGFIGNDWRGSGYDIDLMSAALEALASHNATVARELEAARPDLYPTQH